MCPVPESLCCLPSAPAYSVSVLTLCSLQWHPGSEGARRLLKDFIDGRLRVFDADRAKTDRNSTSRLSPHIHFGEVSARSVAAAAAAKQAEMGPSGAGSVADFLRQLGYREYSRYLSFHFPFTHERALLEHLRAVPWRFDQSLFKAWRTGTTGHPLVDAGMREVWSTGWMHNRLRVVCASFLVKHLLLPWQWGLKHYWDALLDADLECDALGWQYCAGCLVDGHDFSKLTDLATEAKRFDPTGNYVRRWLPVLARLPAAYIHTPWAAPPEVLADAGVELGVNYPWPVIEEGEAAIALAAATEVVNTAIGEEGKAAKAPYLPPTRPDPAAADRVWGAAATDAVPERGANVVHKACLSLNSTDETQSEEVQSNAFALESFSGGRCVLRAGSWTTPLARTEVGGAVSGNPAAAAARAARHVGRPIQSNGVAEAELMLIEEDGGVEMDTNGATGSKSAGGQDGASAGVDGCGGTSGGARGSGGSNPATNTVAVVPTISEAPSGAKVPELVPPEGGRAAGEGGGRLHGAPGPRRRSSGLRSVGVNGAMQIFDSVNGVAAAQGPAVSTDEDVAWPPDQKRHKARSDGY